MIPTVLLASFLASQQAVPRVPAFQPHFNVSLQSSFAPRHQREVVCAMPMVRKTPADDPKILIPPRDTGAVIRRIEPQACQIR